LNLIFNFFLFNSIIRKITFFLVVQNQFLVSESVKVFISIPPEVYYQRILEIKFEPEPQKILKEKWGQKIAYFKIEKLEPYEQKLIKMQVKAEFDFNGFKVFKNGEDLNIYLSDDPYLKLESDILKKVALKLKKRAMDEFEYMKLVLDTISNTLYYNIDGKWEDAEKVFLQGHGSCSEYSFLFSSLMRLGGIPTRFIGASVERKNGIDFTFHRWVEVYINGKGWIPVDPQFYDTPESEGKFFPDDGRLFLITTIEPGTNSYLKEWYNYKVEGKKGIVKIKAFFKWEK
jgi:transglutaminase-like putative cysteine protease